VSHEETYDEALSCLEQGSPFFALEMMRGALDYPESPRTDDEWTRAFDLLARILDGLEQKAIGNLCRAVASALDVDLHYRLGHALIDYRRPAMAASILARAHRLAPTREDVLEELVAALELEGRFDDARRALASATLTKFLTRYLLAFNTLMSGDIDEGRRLTAALQPATSDDAFMRARLDEMFARIDAVQGVTPLDPTDLRGWHFVVTGGLLLHLAPTALGFNGRYGTLEDSEALCLEGIRRLASVLEAWGAMPKRVLAYQNPDSARFSRAVGTVLGIPVRDVIAPEGPGLFVAYDLAAVLPEVLSGLVKCEPGRVVFSHASQWTKEHPTTADATTLLYETNVSPWNRHTIFPHRPDLPSGPPTESDDELANRIVHTPLPADALSDLKKLLDLARAVAPLTPARRGSGNHSRQWAGLPVPSRDSAI
jgi:tetratricopeptide (TPR) repeat protein